MNFKNFLLSAVATAFSFSVYAADNIPDYINVGANKINMNGANWTSLKEKVAAIINGDSCRINVLHIGDSHIQAEFVTNHLRSLLQKRYGNAGRGLMSPLRLAGTNQPHDYSITATPSTKFTQTRLLKCPWPVPPGLTGIAAKADSTDAKITVSPKNEGHEILRAIILTNNTNETLVFESPQDSISFDLKKGESLYGVVAENGKNGILYSAIGNNGACFNDYLLIDDFANGTKLFNPDLIILSMGTNEGFSYMTDAQIQRSVNDLITELKKANPSAAFLILTSMECQKNRNHGYRPLSPFYDVNSRVAQARDIIMNTAARNNVPVWDFYVISGGEGASDKWLKDKLMNKDRIHLVRPGYELMGRLLYDALTDELE